MNMPGIEFIAYMKLFHGTYNTAVICLFFYQGILGLKIRRADPKPLEVVKRHRKTGPVAAVLGFAGFIAGASLVYLDKRTVLVYPFHFITGLAIVSLIASTYIISTKIKGIDPYWRDRHFVIGIIILALYCIQAFLGLGILL